MHWLNPLLRLGDSPNCGKGVYAAMSIRHGEVLAVFGGRIHGVEAKSGGHGVQVHEEFVIGLGRDDPLEPADYINHSCEPNAGFDGSLFLVAMREIKVGEQITFDYAMCLSSPAGRRVPYRMECRCGSAMCRGIVTDEDWKRPDLQQRYAGYFQHYLAQRIARGKGEIPTSRRESCGEGYSWIDPRLCVRETGRYGLGVFVREGCQVAEGELMFVIGGHILTIAEEDALPEIVANMPLELSSDFSIGPRHGREMPEMPHLYVNHSCEPNIGFAGQVCMIAMRAIESGRECCWDYAMSMQPNENSATYFRMKCLCGTPLCRGEITEDDWRLPELQERYGRWFQPSLRGKIKTEKGGGHPVTSTLTQGD